MSLYTNISVTVNSNLKITENEIFDNYKTWRFKLEHFFFGADLAHLAPSPLI